MNPRLIWTIHSCCRRRQCSMRYACGYALVPTNQTPRCIFGRRKGYGINPNRKSGVELLRRLEANWNSLPAAPVANLVPKCIALRSFGSHQRGTEGVSVAWPAQGLHIFFSGLRTGEDTSVPLSSASKTTWETKDMRKEGNGGGSDSSQHPQTQTPTPTTYAATITESAAQGLGSSATAGAATPPETDQSTAHTSCHCLSRKTVANNNNKYNILAMFLIRGDNRPETRLGMKLLGEWLRLIS